MSTTALIILYIFTTLVGIGLIIFGIKSYKKDKNRLKMKRCSVITEAHVSGFDSREKIVKKKKTTEYSNRNTYHRMKTQTYYTPYIKFEDSNGEVYDIKYPYPLERHLSDGQKISIKYNPNNPYEFYILGDKKVQVFSQQAIFYGALITIGSLILLFLNI